MDLKPLMDYYHDRKVWVVDADEVPAEAEPWSRRSD
jgi:hypothetical protein